MPPIQHQVEYDVPSEKVEYFQQNGFVTLDNVVSDTELERYLTITKDMIGGKIDTKDKRGDLGGHTERKKADIENTIQIVHPYMLTSLLDECEHFRKGRDIVNQLYGDSTFALDCSQLLVKFEKTATVTPWHQDQSYYPMALSDKRSANVWLALEDCTVESGCMAFHPTPLATGSLAPHRPAGNGKGALTCDPPSGEPVHTPLKAGSVVVFGQLTFHYGGANNADHWRPAFVGQYRPSAMIQACREQNFDHGKFVPNDQDNAEERTKKRLKLSQQTAE